MNRNAETMREEYIARVNKVQDYIDRNISEEFSLARLAGIANFSLYHFHRIYYCVTGETLFQYIQRLRLEKAARFLIVNRRMPIMDISLECGFSNQSSFAKAFKNYYGMSAARFRSEYGKESNMGKVLPDMSGYNTCIRNNQCGRRQEYDIPYTVERKSMKELYMVYLRHTGPYQCDSALFRNLSQKLNQWAGEKGIVQNTNTRWLTLIHDSPGITGDDKLRISYGMTVPETFLPAADGEFGTMAVPGGKYAVGHFVLAADEYQYAWNALYADWLPKSGYQPDDRPSFELYSGNDCNQTGKQKVDICIPVKPFY